MADILKIMQQAQQMQARLQEAQRKATDLAQQEMGKLTGGLNLPFPFKLPF